MLISHRNKLPKRVACYTLSAWRVIQYFYSFLDFLTVVIPTKNVFLIKITVRFKTRQINIINFRSYHNQFSISIIGIFIDAPRIFVYAVSNNDINWFVMGCFVNAYFYHLLLTLFVVVLYLASV